MIPRLGPLLAAVVALTGVAHAQDPFEIQVYEYETVPRGMWNLETHLNYIARGTHEAEGTVAATNHQTHLTFELTRGITPEFEFGAYLVLADRPGAGPEFVGYRIRPRIRAPERWHLPVGLSLSVEAGFPKKQYEENSVTLELRPIIEKRFGRLQVDLNPTVGRALHGPGTSEGWDLEPGARVAVSTSNQLDLSVEYYGGLGPASNVLPAADQTHLFFLGGDYQIRPNLVWNFGLGLAGTKAGDQQVWKMRLGWLF